MMMLIIVLAEISIALLIMNGVIGYRAIVRHRRALAAANNLMASIKQHQATRIGKLVEQLKDGDHLDDEHAQAKANEIVKKQNLFIQDVINLYHTRDHEYFSKLDHRLQDLLGQYRLGVSVVEATSTADTSDNEQGSQDAVMMSAELEELRAENAKLSSHLRAAERELDQLGREYTSAFNKPKVSKKKTLQSEAESAAHDPSAASEEGSPDRAGPGDDEQASRSIPIMEDVVARGSDEPLQSNEQGDFTAQRDAPQGGEDGDDEGPLGGLNFDELIGDEPGKGSDAAKRHEKK